MIRCHLPMSNIWPFWCLLLRLIPPTLYWDIVRSHKLVLNDISLKETILKGIVDCSYFSDAAETLRPTWYLTFSLTPVPLHICAYKIVLITWFYFSIRLYSWFRITIMSLSRRYEDWLWSEMLCEANTGCSLNVFFSQRPLYILRPLPRQHLAAIGCTKKAS